MAEHCRWSKPAVLKDKAHRHQALVLVFWAFLAFASSLHSALWVGHAAFCGDAARGSQQGVAQNLTVEGRGCRWGTDTKWIHGRPHEMFARP
jgi:hypothetical protein